MTEIRVGIAAEKSCAININKPFDDIELNDVKNKCRGRIIGWALHEN